MTNPPFPEPAEGRLVLRSYGGKPDVVLIRDDAAAKEWDGAADKDERWFPMGDYDSDPVCWAVVVESAAREGAELGLLGPVFDPKLAPPIVGEAVGDAPDRLVVRAAIKSLTSPPEPGQAPDLDALRTLLAAFPRRPLWLDTQRDPETGAVEILGIVAPSTEAEVAAGADEVHEVGDLYPIEATALAVAAINALPWLLDQVERAVLAERVRIVGEIRRHADNVRSEGWNPATGVALGAIVDSVADMVNTLPGLLVPVVVAEDEIAALLDGKRTPLPAAEQPVGAIVATDLEVYLKCGDAGLWSSPAGYVAYTEIDRLLAAGAELLRGEFAEAPAVTA